jgi:hypothetical protein
VVYQFPTKPTWVENIAVRPNGQLLVTLLTSPEVWLINPTNPQQRHSSILSLFLKGLWASRRWNLTFGM